MHPLFSLVPPDSPILRAPCRPVRSDELPALCDQKFLYRIDKFRKQNHGVGIAAPQIGDSRQWFCWARSPTTVGGLVINPRVSFRSGHTDNKAESCLSFPGEWILVERPTEIGVEYTDELGVFQQQHLHYREARVFLHEFDHLQGVCIL